MKYLHVYTGNDDNTEMICESWLNIWAPLSFLSLPYGNFGRGPGQFHYVSVTKSTSGKDFKRGEREEGEREEGKARRERRERRGREGRREKRGREKKMKGEGEGGERKEERGRRERKRKEKNVKSDVKAMYCSTLSVLCV